MSPDVIRCPVKKSGEYYNGAKVVSPDELDQIMEYVEKHISELYWRQRVLYPYLREQLKLVSIV